MNKYGNRKGLTLFELIIVIVVIFVVLILVSLFLPCHGIAREPAKRAVCSTNLNGLGKALILYASTNDGRMPNMGQTEDWIISSSAQAPVAHNTIDDFWAKEKISNLQVYWLLVNDGFMSEKSFKCPSDENWEEKKSNSGEFGFDNWVNCSYGLQIADPGYHSSLKFSEGCSSLIDTQPAIEQIRMTGSTIIAGDQPELKQIAKGTWVPDNTKRSENHGAKYMNLLSASGSVSNQNFSPEMKSGEYNNFGFAGDDIFDYDPTGKGKAPNAAAPNDSYLFQSK